MALAVTNRAGAVFILEQPMNLKIPVALSIIFTILAVSLPAHAQDFGKYFELKAEKYTEEDGEYVGISPAIREYVNDKTGIFIATHPRRFRYVLMNRTNFKGLDSYYPDKKKINDLYLANLAADKNFAQYFRVMTGPSTDRKTGTIKISTNELMRVASKFFFCSSVKPDRSINPYICISLNGVKEAQFEKDMTVVESICFEAIFEAIDAARPKRTVFVENFIRYIDEESRPEGSRTTYNDAYLANVRTAVFRRMENDAELKKHLVEFFRKNTANLPVEITDLKL
jgi:hypothetical protein